MKIPVLTIRSVPIRYKLTVLIVLIVLIPLTLVGIYLYSIISDLLTDNLNKELTQFIESLNDNIESQFDMINNTSLLLLSNPVIRTHLEEASAQGGEYAAANPKLEIEQQLVYSLLYNYAWDSRLLKSVFIFKNVSEYYYLSRYYIAETSIFSDNIYIYESTKDMPGQTQMIPPSPSDKTIYFLRVINSMKTLKPQGKMVFAIDEEILAKTYHSVLQYDRAQAFIFNSEGIVFSHTDKNMLGKQIDESLLNLKKAGINEEVALNGETYIIASRNISNYDLTSIIMVPKSHIYSRLTKNMLSYILLFITVLIISMIFGLYMSSRLTRPYKDLVKSLEHVKNGNFITRMPPYRDRELNEVSEVFNRMTSEIQHLINEVYEKHLLLKESELESLQSQINPHFLFNVLETISWEARMANNETIYRMVTSLGQFLRANISMGSREKITIREELNYIEFYLYLQKTRFGDRLDISISVADESLLDLYLPKLCVQPVVENAIIHGLEDKMDRGKLSIEITRLEDTVRIIVQDNGKGFNSEELDLKNVNTITDRKNGHTSIGLYNSNKRIKLMYGEQYGINISSKPNKGTTVWIDIPADKGE